MMIVLSNNQTSLLLNGACHENKFKRLPYCVVNVMLVIKLHVLNISHHKYVGIQSILNADIQVKGNQSLYRPM